MPFRGLSAAVAAVCVAVVLGGCGQAPWAASVSSASPSATATATNTRRVADNDLATGSAKHRLSAGGVAIDVNYWSVLKMSRWNPTVNKPLNLSLTAHFTDHATQDIYLNNVTVIVAVSGPDGPLTAPDPLTDASSVTPGYLVTRPDSYVKVFNLPQVDDNATSLTLTLTYELLAQSKPKSHTYLKQSASDTLTIALAAS